jgi:hypothetical protein
MKKQASSGGSMSALPHEVMLEMILKLSSVDAPTNWEDLARQYDLSEQEIIELATTETERPASALIHRMVRAGVTVKVLVSFLKNIKREDVVEVLKKARVWSSEEDIPAELTKSLKISYSNTNTSSMKGTTDPVGLRIQLTPPSSPIGTRRSLAGTLAGMRQRSVYPISPGSPSPLTRSSSLINGPSKVERPQIIPTSISSDNLPRVGCQSELQSLFSSSKAFCIQESSDIEKIALVFGNSNYKLEDLNIPTAANDAEAIANKLKSLGWRVRCHQNSTLAIMKKHMLSFYDACNRNQQITAAVLFYAGHAVQVCGQNYALPVDIRSTNSTAYVRQCGINLNSFMEMLQSCLITVILVNASYTVPGWRGAGGLTVPKVQPNCCFAMSYPPGMTQKQVYGTIPGCSPYVSQFVEALEAEPDQSLKSLLSAAEMNTYNPCHFFQSQSLLQYFSFQSPYKEHSTEPEIRHALIIANTESGLSCADELHDMASLTKFLKDFGWKVREERNILSSQLIDIVHNFLYQDDVQANDCTVMVFFIGNAYQTDDSIIYVLGTGTGFGKHMFVEPGQLTVTVDDIMSLMDEAVPGPKVLTVGGTWNVDMECLEKSSFSISPRHNMLVSLFSSEPGVMRPVPELIRRWNEQPNKSLLETFQTVLPRSNWSCLFKA